MKNKYTVPVIEVLADMECVMASGSASGASLSTSTDKKADPNTPVRSKQGSFDDFEDDNDNALYKTYELFK